LKNSFKPGISDVLYVGPERRVAPHARSKRLGEETEPPQAHERVTGVETDGGEGTTPHKLTLAEAER